jgi:hypothetical protein
MAWLRTCPSTMARTDPPMASSARERKLKRTSLTPTTPNSTAKGRARLRPKHGGRGYELAFRRGRLAVLEGPSTRARLLADARGTLPAGFAFIFFAALDFVHALPAA